MIETALQRSEQWPDDIDWEGLAQKAAIEAIRRTPHGDLIDRTVAVEISIRLTDDDEVHTLNRQYRDKDRPTNVLSFPMVQPDMLDGLANSDDGEVLLGDLVLAAGVCRSEAEEKGIALADHAAHLLVHGVLHLLGYDHERGEADAEAMEALECEALAAMGIADPYRMPPSLDEV
ncbi:MAG: rRNA maturation RNase YbeY [Parasphingopyxis sp.]|nr:rRNA maturation RNase YbeY [Sphingomonadales bacterium]